MAAEAGMARLLKADPAAFDSGHADPSMLRSGIADYRSALNATAAKRHASRLTGAQTRRRNAILLEAAIALNPHMYDWDTTLTPGWAGDFILDQYGWDLAAMNSAIADLTAGDKAKAADDLTGVTTMGWAKNVSAEAYLDILNQIYFTPHLLWAEGFLPKLTFVHEEYFNLMGRSATMTDQEILTSLTAKRDAIYQSTTAACREAGSAYMRAARILRTM
jgi:hypothetical protein